MTTGDYNQPPDPTAFLMLAIAVVGMVAVVWLRLKGGG